MIKNPIAIVAISAGLFLSSAAYAGSGATGSTPSDPTTSGSTTTPATAQFFSGGFKKFSLIRNEASQGSEQDGCRGTPTPACEVTEKLCNSASTQFFSNQ